MRDYPQFSTLKNERTTDVYPQGRLPLSLTPQLTPFLSRYLNTKNNKIQTMFSNRRDTTVAHYHLRAKSFGRIRGLLHHASHPLSAVATCQWTLPTRISCPPRPIVAWGGNISHSKHTTPYIRLLDGYPVPRYRPATKKLVRPLTLIGATRQ